MSIPFYAQAVAQSKAQGEAEKAQGIANIRQQLIQFGLVPENFQDKWGALDDTTKALIQKNTDTGISAYARMLDDRKYGITDFVNRLSATGMRRSGTKGAGLRRRQLAFDRNLQDALGALLGNIGGVYNAWSNSEYGRSQYLTNLLAQVYSQYYQPSGGGGGGSAPVASQPQTGYGNYGSYTYSAGTGPTQGYDETRFTGTPGRFLD